MVVPSFPVYPSDHLLCRGEDEAMGKEATSTVLITDAIFEQDDQNNMTRFLEKHGMAVQLGKHSVAAGWWICGILACLLGHLSVICHVQHPISSTPF